jgi:hypothetical protein
VLCVVSRGLCDGLITRPEEFYRLCCVIVCNLETSRIRRLKPASGLQKPAEEEEEEEEKEEEEEEECSSQCCVT